MMLGEGKHDRSSSVIGRVSGYRVFVTLVFAWSIWCRSSLAFATQALFDDGAVRANPPHKLNSASANSRSQSVMLHQHWIEQVWQTKQPVDPKSPLTIDEPVALDPTDRIAVIRWVLSQTADQAVVYPSEQYFYFKFWAGHRLISGNLRFCDAQRGRVHFGYFDEYDQQFLYTGTIEDGVNGRVIPEGDQIQLTFEGMTRTFRLDRSWMTQEGLKLVDGETLVSGILDESGYSFWLIYHATGRRLYFILNEQRLTESLQSIESGGVTFLVGRSSRFIFFVEPESDRKILVGVDEDHVRANDYYDGPFDQVPPDLPLKPILEHIYPYVKDRGGIDEHGNFLSERHARVAISPYAKYTDTSTFLGQATAALNPLLAKDPEGLVFLDLVYEAKMDFHLTYQGAEQEAIAAPGTAPSTRSQTQSPE